MKTIASCVMDNINAERNTLQLIEELNDAVRENQFCYESHLLICVGFDVLAYVIEKTFAGSEHELREIVQAAEEWIESDSSYVHLNDSIMRYYRSLVYKLSTSKVHFERRRTNREYAQVECLGLLAKLIGASQCLDQYCFVILLEQEQGEDDLNYRAHGIVEILIKEASDVLYTLDGDNLNSRQDHQKMVDLIIENRVVWANCPVLN